MRWLQMAVQDSKGHMRVLFLLVSNVALKLHLVHLIFTYSLFYLSFDYIVNRPLLYLARVLIVFVNTTKLLTFSRLMHNVI